MTNSKTLKQFKNQKRWDRFNKILLYFMVVSVATVLTWAYWPVAEAQDFNVEIIKAEPIEEPEVLILTPEQQKVRSEIVRQADIYNIDLETALDIAWCESRWRMREKNPISSGKGTFQFLHDTWRDYCEGSVYDYIVNIKCFCIYFPLYPSWWEECL